MTTPIKVRVDGEEYEVSEVNEFALYPLLDIVGTDLAPSDKKSKKYQEWQDRFLKRFSEPINHSKIAYSLSTLIPSLPNKIAKYALYLQPSGDYFIDFKFGISAMDLLALVDAIAPLLNAKAAEIDGAGKSAPKGFAKPLDTSKAKAGTAIAPPTVAEQRAYLQSQLASLDTDSEV